MSSTDPRVLVTALGAPQDASAEDAPAIKDPLEHIIQPEY